MRKRTMDKENEIFRRQARIHLVVGWLFLLASMWDIGVTYYHYQTLADFTLLEGNVYLVWGLRSGLPFWFNPVILMNFWLGIYYTAFRIPYDPRRRPHQDWFWFVFMAFGAMAHAAGGASWLIFT